MLNKAQDAATNTGKAITSKRESISDSPFEIFELNTLYIILHYTLIQLLKFPPFSCTNSELLISY